MPGAIIGPMTILRRNARIGEGTRVTAFSWIENTVVGPRCLIWSSTAIDCELAEGVSVGPYAYLRGGCQIAENAAIGAHSELNDTAFGASSKCKHFSYLGHASVGRNANIGAGTITCNYDGVNKHRTIIRDDAFVGSDTMLVAPVEVGDGAMTGAGSVVTGDIPSGTVAYGVPARVHRKRHEV